MLKGKNILLGVCAGIAAYKSAYLTRVLLKQGANVRVIMTPSAVNFISPLTFSTLSKNTVYSSYINDKSGDWNNHVELAKWADLLLIAPATQNTMAKMAAGVCDNLLLATYFSMKNRVFIAPAMDLDMYQHPANKKNMQSLKDYGHHFIDAEYGELASGLVGEGRMAEVETIAKVLLQSQVEVNSKLKGKKILITAGPTYEPIDPVRFLGNKSSGKMGYAIAAEAIRRGAAVSLISGPSKLKQPDGLDQLISVKTASEMYQAAASLTDQSDGFIMTAAVSDYRLKSEKKQKIKKKDASLNLELEPTEDILKFVGENKKDHQFVIGFALETEDEEENAKQKLKRKNCDLIVLNSLRNEGTTFNSEQNKIIIFDRENRRKEYDKKSKEAVAVDILDYLEKYHLSL